MCRFGCFIWFLLLRLGQTTPPKYGEFKQKTPHPTSVSSLENLKYWEVVCPRADSS